VRGSKTEYDKFKDADASYQNRESYKIVVEPMSSVYVHECLPESPAQGKIGSSWLTEGKRAIRIHFRGARYLCWWSVMPESAVVLAEVRCAEAVGVAQVTDRPAWLLYPARRPGFRFETGHRSELKPATIPR
jgi:hypothetical protein